MRLLSNLDFRLPWIVAALAMLMSVPAGFAQTPVPDGFLSEPKPVRVGLNLNQNAQPFIIGIDGRNTTTGPVKLAEPVIGPLLRVEGDVSTQAAARRPVELHANSCSGVLLAGQPCAMSLALPPDLGAGRYTVDVMLPGTEGGQSARTIPIHVRASPWIAGLVIAIGVALGALVTDWRSTARPVTNRRIEAASLRARLEKLAGSSVQPAVEMRTRELVRELRALDAEIIAGKDVAQKLADGEKKLVLLQQSELLLNAAGQPKGEAADIFKTLTQRLAGTLEAVEWQDAEVEKAGKTLGAELAGFQRLHEAVVAIDTLAPRLEYGVVRSGPVEKIQTAWARAAELRAQAFDKITGAAAAGTEVAARAAALEAATRELSGMTGDIAAAVLSELRKAIAAELAATPPPTRTRKQRIEALDAEAKNLAASAIDTRAKLAKAGELFRSFETRLPGTESAAAQSQDVPKILSEDSGLKFEWAVGVFQPAAGASAADLQQSVRRWDWITSLVMLAGIAAVGVLVLWVPNTAWGTVQDVILAILAGAGTRLAIGTIAIPGAK